MLEKMGGLAVIVVTIMGLSLLKLVDPPIFIQILFGLAGIVFFLIGNVFLFAQGQLIKKSG